MARDHRKLEVFQQAHRLTLTIYKETRNFPRDEWFGIRLQLRKASVSVPCNLVEGNARRTTREYLNFLNISRASAGEMAYLVELSWELSYFKREVYERLTRECEALIPRLEALLGKMEALLAEEIAEKRRRRKTARNGRTRVTT